MGTYYKHRRVESVKIPYSFKCEHCQKESNLLMAQINGDEAFINSNFKNLSEAKDAKLKEMAHEKLINTLNETYKNIETKGIYHQGFDAKCPHCGTFQSWGIPVLKNKLFENSIVTLIVGIIFCLGVYFLSDLKEPLMPTLAVFGLFAVVAVVFFIVNYTKMSKHLKECDSTSGCKYTPNIDWSGVSEYIKK